MSKIKVTVTFALDTSLDTDGIPPAFGEIGWAEIILRGLGRKRLRELGVHALYPGWRTLEVMKEKPAKRRRATPKRSNG